MVCAYFRVGWTPTHRCCGMECARRFLIIMFNGINPCEALLIRFVDQSNHVSHLTVTLGIWFQTRFLLNRKVLIQGLCACHSGRSNLAHPFTWPSWACKCNSSHFLDSWWSVTDRGTGLWHTLVTLSETSWTNAEAQQIVLSHWWPFQPWQGL